MSFTNGELTGTPAAGTAAAYPITFTATNSAGSVTQSFTLTVYAAPAIGTFQAANTDLTAGTATGLDIAFTGGTATVTFNGGTALYNGSSATSPIAVTSGTSVSVSPSVETTYTLTVVNPAGATVTATQEVNVVAAANTGPCAPGQGSASGSESMLSGRYVLLLKGFDGGAGTNAQGTEETQPEPAMVGGLLAFNGTNNDGLVVTGTIDQNLNSSVGTLTTPATGTYVVANQMACLTLNLNTGPQTVTTQHYVISLANISSGGVAGVGHMLDADNNTEGNGPFTAGTLLQQQTPAPTSLSGTYAFGLDLPQNSAQGGGKNAVAGVIDFQPTSGSANSGSATILEFDTSSSTGVIDGQGALDPWLSTPPSSSTGSYSLNAGGSGRGMLTVTFTPPGATAAVTSTYIVYAASSSVLLIMGSQDQTANTVLGGEAMLQSPQGGEFGLGSLDATTPFVQYTSGVIGLNATTATSYTQLVLATSNGSGTIESFNSVLNNAGTISVPGTTSFSYTVDPNGRVLASDGAGPLYYLVSQNYGFVLGFQTATNTGMIEPQSSTATPAGTFAMGTIDEQDTSVSVLNGVLSFTAPTLSGTSNSNGSPPIQATQLFNSFTKDFSVSNTTGLGLISPNDTSCELQITGSAPVTNPCQYVFTVIAGNRFAAMPVTPGVNQTTLIIGDQ